MNNQFNFNEDQLLAKKILELAGYNIKVADKDFNGDRTYRLFEGDKVLKGYSSLKAYLKPERVIDEIKELSHVKGFRKGYNHFRATLNTLLSTEDTIKIK